MEEMDKDPQRDELNENGNSSKETGGNQRVPFSEAADESREESGDSLENNEADLLREELNKMNDKYLRLLAEFDNFRRRTAKDQLELRKTASKDIMTDLLPVLDDFDRALKLIKESDQDDSVLMGFKLVYQKLSKILESKGLLVMDSEGKAFDPEMHEAITEVPAPSKKDKGKVLDTVEKGYLLNDKIIRYAKVVVGK
nr:nucleotide exchange factor GrpE [Saprospiraceae bacterium]